MRAIFVGAIIVLAGAALASPLLRRQESAPMIEATATPKVVAKPISIAIPSIGVTGSIVEVGIASDGNMAAPADIATAGWFIESVRPGEKGLSIIDGHITSKKPDGIFQQLSKLKSGEQFNVTLADGQTLTYEIREVQTVELDEAAAVLYSQEPGVTSQLNLITCSGAYDTAAKTFTERTIVSAVLSI